ncbi:hypothetical protein P3342_005163 [Pyrenophora teres f. teres]|nr:hypothetical protein P3342_005163 [Pyrenophora teres f. teres]
MSQTHTTTAPSATLPDIMQAWQFKFITTTLSQALQLNPSAPLPSTPLNPGEYLIQVHYASLNPVDYKLPELPLIPRLILPSPCTPGLDFSGRVVAASPTSTLPIGTMVFGKLEPKHRFGSLGAYIVGSKEGTVPLPSGVSAEAGATLGVCGLVTYQCLQRNVKAGDHVLINGGSGGTGTFAVQIAKALGCTVTTTCSGANAQLCRDLGADHVIDYRTESVVDVLAASGRKVNFVLDNVGATAELYWQAPRFTAPDAKYVQIGSQVSVAFLYDLAWRFLVPAWLGGGQRAFAFGKTVTNYEDFVALAKLVAAGRVRPVVQEVVGFEGVRGAYDMLRAGRCRGKIVVRVLDEKDE